MTNVPTSTELNCWLDKDNIPDQVNFRVDEDNIPWWKFLGEQYDNYSDFSFKVVGVDGGYSVWGVNGSQFAIGNSFQYLNQGQQADFNFKFAVFDNNGTFIKEVSAHVTIDGRDEAKSYIPDNGPLNAQDVVFETDDNNNGAWIQLKDHISGPVKGFILSNDTIYKAGIHNDPNDVNMYSKLDFFANQLDLDAMNVGDTKTIEMKYKVYAEDGSSSREAKITIVVHGVNDAPVAQDDAREVQQGEILTYDAVAAGKLTDVDSPLTSLGIKDISQIKIGTDIISDAATISKYASIVDGKIVFNSSAVNLNGATEKTVEICYTASDFAKVGAKLADGDLTIVVKAHITPPPSLDIIREDDEDGAAGNAWNDTTTPDQLVFKLYDGVLQAGTTFEVPTSVTIAGKTYTLTNNGNGTVSLDKAQFQYLTQDQIETLNFKFKVITQGGAVTKSVTFDDALTGSGNNTYWGGLKIVMRDTNGNVIDAAKHNNVGLHGTGIGNNSGRIGEIDFDKDTGKSESIELDFQQTVTSTKIKLNLFYKEWSETGAPRVEVLVWKAYDANGNLVSTGKIFANEEIGEGIDGDATFSISGIGGFSKVVLSATYYNDNPDNGNFTAWNDSTDFVVNSVEYTVGGTVTTDASGKIIIHGLNDVPVVKSVTFTDNEDGTGLQNDGVINFKLPTATDIDGTIARYELSGAVIKPLLDNTYQVTGSDGKTYTLTFNAVTGEINFNKDQFQSLQNGTKIDFDLSYKAIDNNGGASNPASSKITINGVNDAPVDADENYGAISSNGAPLQMNLVANTTDIDAGDTATIKSIDSIVVNGQTITGSAITQYVTFVNGVATLNPAAFNVPVNGHYAVTINYTIQDSQGAIDTSKAILTIDGVKNLPPVVAFTCEMDNEDGTAPANTGDTNNIKFKFNAYDPEGGPLTFKLSGTDVVSENNGTYQLRATDGKIYTAVIDADGKINFDKAQFQSMNVDSALLEFNVDYTATDNMGASATAKACFQITGLNDAPIDGDENYGNQSVYSSTGGFAMNLVANTTDIDAGDTAAIKSIDKMFVMGIEYSAGSLAKYVTFVGGVATLNTELLAKDLGLKPGQSMPVEIQYTITDKFGLTDKSVAKLTLIDDRTPIDAKDVNYTDNEDGTGVDEVVGEQSGFKFSFNATGPNPISYTTPASVTIDGHVVKVINNGDGTFNLDAADLQWMNPTMVRNVVFNYTATDKITGQSDIATAKVVIQGLNDAPVDGDEALGLVDAKAAPVVVNLVANSSDIDSGDVVTIKSIDSISYAVGNATVAITDPAEIAKHITFVNGVATINPASFNIGAGVTTEFTISYTVTDSFGATDASKATISIKNSDVPPTANNFTYTDNEDGTGDDTVSGELAGFKFKLDISNPTNLPITAYTLPASVVIDGHTVKVINGNDGTFTLDAADLQWMSEGTIKDVVFNYSITSQYGTSSASAKVVITGLNDAPVDGDENYGVQSVIGNNLQMNLVANTTDIDTGDVASIKSINKIFVGGVELSASVISQYISFNGGVATLNYPALISTFGIKPGDSLPVEIRYTITDKFGATDDSVAKLTITDPRIPVDAKDVSYTDNEDGVDADTITGELPGFKFKFDVSNPENHGLTYSTPASVTIDGHVVKVINGNDGTFTLDAADLQWMNPEMVRDVVFNYTVTDTVTGLTDTAKATVKIQGLNDAPVDGDEALGNIAYNAGSQVVNLLTNMTDIDAGDTKAIKSIDSVTFNGQTITGANIANYVTFDAAGNATINPAAFNVPAGVSYPITINYTVTDKWGATDASKVTLAVTNGTQPPVPNDVTYTDTEDATGADTITGELPGFKFALNVSNPSNLALTYNLPATVVIDGHVVKVINNNDGTFNLDTADLQWMSEGLIKDLVFQYTVSSSAGTSLPATAKVILTGLNDAPVANDDGGYNIVEGQSVKINVLANDTDIDVNDVVSVKNIASIKIGATTITDPIEIAKYVTITSDGQVLFNSTGIIVATGTTTPIEITYTAKDILGATDTAKIFINLGNNDNPVIYSTSCVVTEDGTSTQPIYNTDKLEYQLSAADANGDKLTYTLVQNNATYPVTLDPITGKFTVDAQQFQYLNPGQQVDFFIKVKVIDAYGNESATIDQKVTVTGVNDLPTDGDENYGTINGNLATYDLNLVANATDVDTGDVVTIKSVDSILVTPSTGVAFTISGAQLANYITYVNGYATLKPGAFNVPTGSSYTLTINYTVEDKAGATDTSKATVKLQSINNAPVDGDENVGVVDINNGNPPAIDVLKNATDPNGDVVTVKSYDTIKITDKNGTVLVNSNDPNVIKQYFDLTDPAHPVLKVSAFNIPIEGLNDIVLGYTVQDPQGLTDTSVVKVTLTNPDHAPDAVNDGVIQVTEGTTITVNVLANDTDPDTAKGDAIHIDPNGFSDLVIDGVPVPANEIANYISIVNGKVVFNASSLNADPDAPIDVSFKYTIVDNYGKTDTATVTLQINDDGTPTANDVNTTDNEDGLLGANNNDLSGLTFKLTAIDNSDPKNDLTYKIDPSAKAQDLGGNNYKVTGSDGKVYDVMVNPNTGIVTFNKAQFQALNPDQNVTFNFNWTVTDAANGKTDTAAATFKVLGVNDAPVDADEALATVQFNATPVSVNLLVGATDIDNNDVVTLKQIDSIVFNGQTITGAANIANYVTFLPNGTAVINPSAFNVPLDSTYAVTINYTVTDTYGATDTSKATISVVNGNVPPKANNVDYTDTEDATGADTITGELPGFKFALNVTNTSNLPLTYSTPASVVIDGHVVKVINNNDGTFNLDTADLQWMTEGLVKDLSFTYTVNYNGGSTSAIAKVVLTGINDAPVDGDEAYGTVTSTAGNQVLNLVANATDVDSGDVVTIKSIDSITFNGQTITGANIANYVTFVNGVATLNPEAFNVPIGTVYNVIINYTVKDIIGATNTSVATISVANGNDIAINADDAGFKLITNTATADNVVTPTDMQIFNKTVTYAGDIKDGNAADDKIIGDIRNYKIDIEAGDANATVKNSISGNADARSDAAFVNNKINFGADTIDGKGGNDILIGDVDVLTLLVKQGNASAVIDYSTCGGNPQAYASANASIQNNTFKFGNDVLKGGEGNDKLVGDVANFDTTYLSGTRTEVDTNHGSAVTYKAYGITGNTFTFGNDTLEGGNGDDVMVGDVEHIKYVDHLTTYVLNTSTGKLEATVTDHLYDFDISDTAAFNAFKLSQLYTQNTFTFGADTFVFDASAGFGNDKIKDFSVNGVADKIKFDNLLDVDNNSVKNFADLQQLTKVVNDGSGHVKLMVDTNHDGNFESSITFLNKDFITGNTDVSNYFTASDFII